MMPEFTKDDFAKLAEWDELVARAVAAAGCRCGGPLHVANYQRKPRGAAIAASGEVFTLRHSLCCGRKGCRKRTLPPSLRFLGRRVYLEVVVLFASLFAQAAQKLRAARDATKVPAWTLRRWLGWWQHALPEAAWWKALRARLTPPPEAASLPDSFVRSLASAGAVGPDVAWLAARCLAPGTTRSPIDAARFVRDVAGRSVAG